MSLCCTQPAQLHRNLMCTQSMPRSQNKPWRSPACKPLEPIPQELDLSGCQCLTDAAVCGLAAACPRLRAVNLSSCYELTDAAFAALGACARMQRVNACGCDRLTDAGLAALAAGAG